MKTKNSLRIVAVFILIFSLFMTSLHAQTDKYSPNRLIAKFKTSEFKDLAIDKTNAIQSNHLALNQLNTAYNCTQMMAISPQTVRNPMVVFEFSDNISIEKIIEAYKASNLFEYVEPDYVASGSGVRHNSVILTPNDPYFSNQWGLKNDGNLWFFNGAVSGADINATKAWDITTGSSQIIVGVIDTGLKLDHPELAGRIWVNSGELAGNCIDDDANGFIDDINGWDYINNDNNPTDDYGHGTNVTSIICTNGNNNQGLAGVNWQCKVMAIKVLGSNNSGGYSGIINAIYYAVNKGAKVINMSLGGSGYSSAMQEAVNYAYENDVLIVACMMNDNNGTLYYPAALNHVMAVGSIDPDNKRSVPFFWSSSSGSNYGNHISVCAPGNYIYGLDAFNNDNYSSYWGGTSQATPYVSGLATLILGMKPNRKPDEVKSIIERTATDQIGLPSEDVRGFDQYHGWGRVDALNALLENIKPLISYSASSVYPGQTISLWASGCIGTLLWSTGQTADTIYVSPLYRQLYRVSCQNAGYSSPMSNFNVNYLTNPPCNTTYTINGAIPSYVTVNYQASVNIVGSGMIWSNADVTFDAKQYVDLKPGFFTSTNSIFLAKIGGCQ